MILRPATMTDVPMLRYWDTKAHVREGLGANHDGNWEAELQNDADWGECMIAEEKGRPVGFIRIIDPAREETHYWGDVEADLRAVDIWIGEEADLGRGLGGIMMRLALEKCFADPHVKAVLLDPTVANIRAHRFYERLGFRFIERKRLGNDDCRVYRLERDGFAG
ncbi:GNAT family N-acetyltransferase [Stappia sp. GBMRC 2046]|uniref:GNAT family N-acetyltransferase n=1 Tax=Stappia sediminis TaxID=2692190 RepID=A0A7X3S8J7_9HYPH|nr:GNAT family N-acetyltransferase [Stappia sediminis]MXN65835.1 GNAT family N-acetyltransferase [Stappia sediminis]